MAIMAIHSWAANPFSKQRLIGSMKFLKGRLDRAQSKIDEQKQRLKSDKPDFEQIEMGLEEVEQDLEKLSVLVSENPKAEAQRYKIVEDLKGAQRLLVHTRKKKEFDDIFANDQELRWQEHTDLAKELKGDKGKKLIDFLVNNWEDEALGMYKKHWLDLISGETVELFDFEATQKMIKNVEDNYTERAKYLAGVRVLEEGKRNDSIEAFRRAEGFFKGDFQDSKITNLGENNPAELRAEANARIFMSLLQNEHFVNGAWLQNWGKFSQFWSSMWKDSTIDRNLRKLSPTPSGLIPQQKTGKSKLEQLLKEEKAASESNREDYSTIKLAWIYSGIGWHEEAVKYLKRELDSSQSNTSFLGVSYFYGHSLEETYVQNGFSSWLYLDSVTNSDPNFPEKIHRVYNKALQLYKDTFDKFGNLSSSASTESMSGMIEKIDYMERWVQAYDIYKKAKSIENVQEILQIYKSALKKCPESFFFRDKCFELFTQSWSRYESIGFTFYGYDEYYKLTFTGNDRSDYRRLVQIISLIQFFGKVTSRQSSRNWSIDDVTPNLIKKEFLSEPYFDSISPNASRKNILRAVYKQFTNRRMGRYGVDVLETHKEPWHAVEVYINEGDDHRKKNLPLKAMRFYLKSIVLVPTFTAYDRLEQILSQMEANITNSRYKGIAKRNSDICQNEKGTLR